MKLFLSRLLLNPASARARADSRQPYELHRTLSRAFGDDPETYREARCLFRLDEAPPPPRVLVQSCVPPDWSTLPDGYLTREAEVKEIRPGFEAGQQLRFLLLANPTRREPAGRAVHAATGKPTDGPRRALVSGDWAETETACREWLARKGERGGFTPLGVALEDRGVVRVSKGGGLIPYAAIRFEGCLQVTDAERFTEVLREGVGTAKSFGFGLLSLAPVR